MKEKYSFKLLTAILVLFLSISAIQAHKHSINGPGTYTDNQEDPDDDITILNRLNFLHVDIEDIVYFDLTKHFFYNKYRKPIWSISESYNDRIQIYVHKKITQDADPKKHLE